MKPQLLKVPSQLRNSFSIRKDAVPYFYNHWHYHPEIELILIQKGKGTQFIGDSISNFKEGDLLLVGANLPHLWRCDEAYHQGHPGLIAEAIVIHFLQEFWGEKFLEMPEMEGIRRLFTEASKGISIKGQTNKLLSKKMQAMLKREKAERISSLIDILHIIADAPENEISFLSLSDFHLNLGSKDRERINAIYNYTFKNYSKDIKLQELADLICMNRLAFCRYFKSKTGKSYVRFLTEVRLGEACKLLIEDNLSISQVALEAGYNNYSNFTRQFKNIINLTPAEYRRKHHPKVKF